MTTPNKSLIALAERCEAASEADRDIDLSIMRYAMNIGGAAEDADRYTASIGAALTLVDDRALWACGDMEEVPFTRLCWPQPGGGFSGGYFQARAVTVPLSICAAALRARAQAIGEDGE